MLRHGGHRYGGQCFADTYTQTHIYTYTSSHPDPDSNRYN